jgi:hypothetical protein
MLEYLPNGDKIYQMALRIPKRQKCTQIFHSKAFKNEPKPGIFLYENKQFGNPA